MPLSWNGTDINRVYWKDPSLSGNSIDIEKIYFTDNSYNSLIWYSTAINGDWLLDENIFNASIISESIDFNSATETYSGIEYVKDDPNYPYLIYRGRGSNLDKVVGRYVSSEAEWGNAGYRILNFGNAKLFPSREFYNWLNNYATKMVKLTTGTTYKLNRTASKVGFAVVFPYRTSTGGETFGAVKENYFTTGQEFTITPDVGYNNNGDGTYTLVLRTNGIGDIPLSTINARPTIGMEYIYIIGASILEEVANTPKATITIGNDAYGEIKVTYKENNVEKTIYCPPYTGTNSSDKLDTTFTADAGSQFTMQHMEGESLWWNGMYDWNIVYDYGSIVTVQLPEGEATYHLNFDHS